MVQGERAYYFDWIRGCMILWMLIYHISLNYGRVVFGVPECRPTAFTFMSFFMAPFYMISGYFFSSNKGFKNFFHNKVKKLLVPYCLFSIWGVIIFELFSLFISGQLKSLQLSEAIPTGGLRQNTPLWFFVSLLFCNIIYYCLTKMGGVARHFMVFMCFVLAFMTSGERQFLGYGNVLLGIPFMHFGFNLQKYKGRLMNPFWAIVALIIYLAISIKAPQRLEFVRNILVQGDYMLNFLFTLSACFFLWSVSQKWKHDNMIGKSLIYIGRNSLVFFAFHRPVLNWIIEPLVFFVFPNASYYLFLPVCLVSILLGGYLLNFFLYKYFPLLIGA